jgi:hypothetical protein
MTKTFSSTEIQTFTGKVIDLGMVTADDIDIRDIAHALSLINRYTGHTLVPYSVAQHSVHVSNLVGDEFAKWGLMHDASEAYLGDVSRPLKSMLPDYKLLEEMVQRAVADKFGLTLPIPPEVKAADNVALMAEKRDLMGSDLGDWGISDLAAPDRITPFVSWRESKSLFLERFDDLWHP